MANELIAHDTKTKANSSQNDDMPPLILSPLVDQKLVPTREIRRMAKPKPKATPPSYEGKLLGNPYGISLISSSLPILA